MSIDNQIHNVPSINHMAKATWVGCFTLSHYRMAKRTPVVPATMLGGSANQYGGGCEEVFPA